MEEWSRKPAVLCPLSPAVQRRLLVHSEGHPLMLLALLSCQGWQQRMSERLNRGTKGTMADGVLSMLVVKWPLQETPGDPATASSSSSSSSSWTSTEVLIYLIFLCRIALIKSHLIIEVETLTRPLLILQPFRVGLCYGF